MLIGKNSLFGLNATEVFIAHGGILLLARITFGDPQGPAPVAAAPEAVDDLYHTSASSFAQGLAKLFKELVYCVGGTGDPKLHVRGLVRTFSEEICFGGGVHTATTSTVFERFRQQVFLPGGLKGSART